jgi:hypothetical protein
MARNSSGVYSLPESAFVPGTTILSASVNNDFNDIATALTQSLATTGVSTMTGQIKAASGTVSAPGYAFGSALTTGFYLSGTNEISWAAAGVLAATFAATGAVTWVGAQTFSAGVTSTTGVFTTGVIVGFSGTPTADRLEVGDATFYLDRTVSTAPVVLFDTDDYLQYDRSNNRFNFIVGTVTIAQVDDTFTKVTKNFIVDNDTIIIATAGYVDAIEISAPASPSANVSRLYTRDLSGATILAYKDSAGVETILTPPNRGYTSSTAATNNTAQIPQDNTIPQITEGTQLFTLDMSTNKSDSKVRITVSIPLTSLSDNVSGTFAVFFDSNADAIGAASIHISSGNMRTNCTFSFDYTPGDSNSHTYSLRYGPSSSATMYINSTGVGTILGGSTVSNILVEEVYV